MNRPEYRPNLVELADGTVEQSYVANSVYVSDEMLAFGELIPDKKRGLPYGTPVHSLVVHLDENGEPETYELNDQANAVSSKAVQRIEWKRGTLRLTFAKGKGPRPGRVSLDPSLEVFAPSKKSALPKGKLGALAIALETDAVTLKEARARLRAK